MRISDWSSDVCSSDLCRSRRASDRSRSSPDRPERVQRLFDIGDQVGGVLEPDLEAHEGAVMIRRAERAMRVGGGRQAFEAAPAIADPEQIERVDKGGAARFVGMVERSEEHTSELQSLMRISYAVFCLKKKKK